MPLVSRTDYKYCRAANVHVQEIFANFCRFVKKILQNIPLDTDVCLDTLHTCPLVVKNIGRSARNLEYRTSLKIT